LGSVNKIDLNQMIGVIKAHPDFRKAGMIASHVGIVRSFSRDGKAVSGVHVEFDGAQIEAIITDIKSRPGIVDVLIETNSGHLKVGDHIVTVMVAGDIRDHVFPALIDAVNRLKSEAVTERERLID
jgi:molybdopterin synthase catalytic subunit